MPANENRSVALRFLEEVFNGKNLSAVDDLVAAKAGSSLTQSINTSLFLTAFPDCQLNSITTIAAGDSVVCQGTLTGTHTGFYRGLPPSGRRVSIQRVDVFRLARGKIVESWNVIDLFELLRQLGADSPSEPPPEPVLELKEIQGNSLAGFNKNYQSYLFMQIDDPAAAQA